MIFIRGIQYLLEFEFAKIFWVIPRPSCAKSPISVFRIPWQHLFGERKKDGGVFFGSYI